MVSTFTGVKGWIIINGAVVLMLNVYLTFHDSWTINPHGTGHWYRKLTTTNSDASADSPAVPAAATAGYTFGWMADAAVSAICFWVVQILYKLLETVADVCFGGMDIAKERWGRSGRRSSAHSS
jgi:hypothetical protein